MNEREVSQDTLSSSKRIHAAKEQVEKLEREAKALGSDISAALLFHEIGILWEEPLKNARNAALAYQTAFQLAPKFLANIRSARRLFSQAGNWSMVVQLIDAEISAVHSQNHAPLLYEKAKILDEHLSAEAEANRVYGQCLQLRPKDLNVLTSLEQVYVTRKNSQALVQIYKLMAEALTDAKAKAHYLTSAGIILEETLSDAKEAGDCFRKAFSLDRRDPLLIFLLKRRAEQEGRADELLAALIAEASLSSEFAAPVFLQISKIYERLGRLEDAIAALDAGRQSNPQDMLVLSELARLLEATRKYEELAEVLLALTGLTVDKNAFIEINLRLASLYEEKLQQEQYAITRYQTILAKDPRHPVALGNLGKLYARHQDWVGLLATFDAEIASLEDPAQKVPRLYKSAEILELRLGRTDQAIARYKQCLQWQPEYLPAQRALIRRYQHDERYAELVEIYEQELTKVDDKELRVGTLMQLADLYEKELGNSQKAIECLKKVLELVPDHRSSFKTLARLFESNAQWRDLVLIQEREATLSRDLKHSLFLLHRNAELLEERLNDRNEAISAYERLLSLSPNYLPALQALGRLYAQDGRWEDLIRICQNEVELTSSSDHAASLMFRIAEVYETSLRDFPKAMAAYHQTISLSSTWFIPAAQALARVYRQLGEWQKLLELLHKQTLHQSSPYEKANTLFHAATIWEEQLRNSVQAFETYQEAVRLQPQHLASLQAMKRLVDERSQPKEMHAVLELHASMAHQPSRIVAALQLARIHLNQHKDLDAARQWTDRALLLEPDNFAALRMMSQYSQEDRFRRADLKLRAAECTSDVKLRAALRLSAAEDKDFSMDLTSADVLSALLRSTVKEHPDATRFVLAYERLLRQTNQLAALADWYTVRASQSKDIAERTEFWLRAGTTYEFELQNDSKASQAYGKALEGMPRLFFALEAQARVCLRLGLKQEAADAFEAQGHSLHDAQGAADAWVLAGTLRHQLGDIESAKLCFQRALERSPQHPQALDALEALSFVDLTPQSERLIGRLTPVPIPAPDDAVAENIQSIQIEMEDDAEPIPLVNLKQMTDDEPVSKDLAAATAPHNLPVDTEDVALIQEAAEKATQAEDWASAHFHLEKLVELSTSPEQRILNLLQLAGVRDRGFNDLPGALALLETALEISVNLPELWGKVDAAFISLGTADELRIRLEDIGKARPEHLELHVRLAELYANKLAQPEQAVLILRRQIEKHPGSTRPLESLAQLYSQFPNAGLLEVETHRAILRLQHTHSNSLHALFLLFEKQGQADKAFCVASILFFLGKANDVEKAFYHMQRDRLPVDTQQRLSALELEGLIHPLGRGLWLQVLRAIGDTLSGGSLFNKPLPMPTGDRLPLEAPLVLLTLSVVRILGVETVQVYSSDHDLVRALPQRVPTVEMNFSEFDKLNLSEKRFLLGQVAMSLANKSALLKYLDASESQKLVASSLQLVKPEMNFGEMDHEEELQELRSYYPQETLEALQRAVSVNPAPRDVLLPQALEAMSVLSEDRAGLLLCIDVALGLFAKWKQVEAEGRPVFADAMAEHPALRELISYALSEDFFRYRQKLGLSIPH